MINIQNNKICPYHRKCGGCQLQNLNYSEQLHYKMAKEIKLLGSFAHVKEIVGMENPLHYRCKVQAAFDYKNGKIISGIYQSSTHTIVSCDDCLIEDTTCDLIIKSIRTLMPKYKMTAFDEKTNKGFLRHVLIRRGYNTNQFLVVLVAYSDYFPNHESFVSDLIKIHPEITTIVLNVNDEYTSLVLGKKNKILFGNGYIEDTIASLRFRISPDAFFQVNPQVAEKIYLKAIDLAGLNGREKVIDAYCGTGTIGMIASLKSKVVIGIESTASAVKDGIENAKINNCKNISFICNDATKIICEIAKNNEKIDVLFMDPPRAGSTPQFIHAASSLSPNRIVYISCNPETLRNDLQLFRKNHYIVKTIQPFDMFPYTEHIETVVLMSRKKD